MLTQRKHALPSWCRWSNQLFMLSSTQGFLEKWKKQLLVLSSLISLTKIDFRWQTWRWTQSQHVTRLQLRLSCCKLLTTNLDFVDERVRILHWLVDLNRARVENDHRSTLGWQLTENVLLEAPVTAFYFFTQLMIGDQKQMIKYQKKKQSIEVVNLIIIFFSRRICNSARLDDPL